MIDVLLKNAVLKKIRSFSQDEEIKIFVNFVDKTIKITDSINGKEIPFDGAEMGVAKSLLKSKLNIDSIEFVDITFNTSKKEFKGFAYFTKNNRKQKAELNF